VKRSTTDQCDYLVIGAGSAGCVLANRLSANGKYRVMLLEAGGRDSNPWIHVPLGYGKTMFNERINWMFETEPEPELANRRIKQPRGKVLGGSSAINGLLYVRGQREDYDHWRDLGNLGWGYDDVLRYFKKAEDQQRGANPWHGVGGPLAVSDLAERHPLATGLVAAATNVGLPYNEDFNGERQEGVGFFQATVRRGLRCSTAVAYLRPARGRANLHVVANAVATRIVFDALRAVGCAYRVGNQERMAIASREVILAAGALQSPQLLQLSGVGPADVLARHGIPIVADLRGVGVNLQDHLQARLIYECNVRCTLNDDLQSWPRMLRAGMRFALKRQGPLTWWAGLAGGFARTRADLARPDVQFQLFPFSSDRVSPKLHIFSGFTILVYKLRPESRGTVQIRSADPSAPPSIRPNYLADPRDLRTLLEGVKLVRRIAADPAMAVLIKTENSPGAACTSDADLTDYIRHNGISVYHPVGTCRMGHDPLAVVDDTLRVHGLSGLRVVDASIMPDLVSGNTNAAIIMIGEKAADLILQSAEGDNRQADANRAA
jgi:choline dehydrogenase